MPCSECGAADDGATCRERFDERLALEFSDLRAGRVHLHTVACYQLQHPSSFQLDEDARVALGAALADVELRGVPVAEVRRRMGDAFAGATRVRVRQGEAAAPSTPPRPWSMTIADLGPLDPDTHAEEVRRWARAVLADIGEL